MQQILFIQMLKKYSSPLLALSSLLLICLVFFHQPLFSGEIVNATDILTQSYFWNVFMKENLAADPCFRTWLPYINAGTSFSGGLDLLFRPVMFLTLLIFPVHIAINYEMVVYFFLLGAFMYFYMRELEVSPLSALLSALFLMLNGEIVSLMNAGHVNKIGAIFPTPLVFLAFERALRRKTLSAFLLAGTALGFEFWQGHIQISFYLCIAVGIYYVIRAGIMYRQEKNPKQIWKLTAYALLMVIVFLLLSAYSFLPQISFAQLSERAQGVSYEFATSWSLPPEELVTYIIPGFFGLRRTNHVEDEENVKTVPYWGRAPFMQTGRYFGLLPLLLLLLALCFVRNKHVLTLAVIAFVVLLLGMGRYFPPYKLLYEYAPGFNMFRVPQMIMFLFAFATSGLAGFGVEWLLSDFSETKDKRLRIFLIACIMIFLVSWLITLLLPQLKPTLLSRFSEALLRKDGTPEIAEARFQNIFRGFLQFNVFLGITLFILGLRLVKNIRIWGLVLAIILLYLVDIWLFNEKYIDTVPIEGSWYISENDAIRYFKEHPGLYRILSLADTPKSYRVANKYLYHHIFSVSGYEAVGVQYYNEYLQNMALGTALVDLLNIKYIILPKNIKFDDGQPVEVGKTIGPYKIVMDADTVLLENLNSLPRAFPVHNAYVIKTGDEILSALLNPAFNPGEFVVLEERPNVSMSTENVPSSQSKAQITYYHNRTIQLKVAMATEGFLVLSEKYYPGWKAYVNGQQTKIYKANYTLQAIFLPKGEHAVTFSYQPTQFMLGFIITMLTCFSLVGFFVGKKTLKKHKFARFYEKIEHVSQKENVVNCAKKLLWGLICFGIILHVVKYTQNYSFSVDEVGTVLSMIKKPFSELLQPLDGNVSAPVGFVFIEKLLVKIFGDSEYVLRLFPFLSRILAIVLFYRIATSFLKKSVVPIALGLFVFSERLFSWGVITKQYSSDVFFALLILMMTLWIQSKEVTISRAGLWALIGAIAIWCSYPAVFILAGIGLSITISCIIRKKWKTIFRLSLAYLFWGVSFLVNYMVSLRHLNNDDYLTDLAHRNSMPFPPMSFSEVELIIKMFVDYIGYALGWSQAIFKTIYSHSIFDLLGNIFHRISSPETSLSDVSGFLLFGLTWVVFYLLAIFMFFLGCRTLLQRSKEKFFFLLFPACFLFIASGLFKLPLRHRLLLFLIPSIILCIVTGIAQVREKTKNKSFLLMLALVGIFFIYPVLSISYTVIKPKNPLEIPQHIKPIIQYLKEHKQEGDIIYVYYAAGNLFEYYSEQFGGFEDDVSITGVNSRNNWDNYMKDLDQLRENKRVWVLFSHFFGYEEYFFLSYLDSIGTRLDAFVGNNTAVYLYDFSQHEGS